MKPDEMSNMNTPQE